LLKPLIPKFIVRNRANKALQVLDIKIPKDAIIDLFRARVDLQESQIIDSMRVGGELYLKINETGQLEIIQMELVSFSYPVVGPSTIVASNEPSPGKYLTIDSYGNFCWQPAIAAVPQKTTKVIVDPRPAQLRENGTRIWQYQDIPAPVPAKISLVEFQNGKNLFFNKSSIVDGSAFVVTSDDKIPKIGSFFNKQSVTVRRHVGDEVELTSTPRANEACRVYFLVSWPAEFDVPENYRAAPEIVKRARADHLDYLDVDFGENKTIRGKKTFKESVTIDAGLSVSHNLGVGGAIEGKGIQLLDGAATHHTLVSDAMGRGVWAKNPTVSVEPPGCHFAGQVWIRETDFEAFVFDGPRDAWLSLSSSDIVTGKIQTISNDFLDIVGPSVILQNSIITDIFIQGGDTQSWRLDIKLDDQVVSNLSVINSTHSSFSGLNIKCVSGQKLSIFVTGEDIILPTARLRLKTLGK
jgi:hypothetical protein